MDGVEPEHVLISQGGDRTFDLRGRVGALADFSRYFRSQSRIGRLLHQAQRLADSIVGNELEERRLLKLHGKSLPQRAIEHRVARCVTEISKDNRVLFG